MKKVILKITGTQNVEGNKDEVEVSTVGTLRDDGSAYIIRYNEQYEPPEPNIKVNLRIQKDGRNVQLTRSAKGESSYLSIEKANRNLCQYATPYGNIMLGIYGKNIELKPGDSEGSFFFNYDIDINGAVTSNNSVKVEYVVKN